MPEGTKVYGGVEECIEAEGMLEGGGLGEEYKALMKEYNDLSKGLGAEGGGGAGEGSC